MQRLADGIKGLLAGAFVGGAGGLGVCIWLFADPPFFTGDTVLIGAVLFGLLGFLYGETFFDWLKEHWWWFT